ncbi:hypothetical protein COCCADRAFT_789 [Bipolaris zeicola 26-R-13]|uniref:Uncharacterized protein n=1 Tax=Cochliobolus carbonum (strain 26-R-13) TaxID=930089 RepID=W6Z487_COCC2|nr:uncharacterized protein COCCADRAFT_789 [Bipolaris zeicola 26-R-13]EUC38511.1 hypothetical protein COCCADRAFT_789 [Bipolaris zeicola 26-R-13]
MSGQYGSPSLVFNFGVSASGGRGGGRGLPKANAVWGSHTVITGTYVKTVTFGKAHLPATRRGAWACDSQAQLFFDAAVAAAVAATTTNTPVAPAAPTPTPTATAAAAAAPRVRSRARSLSSSDGGILEEFWRFSIYNHPRT